MNIKTLPVSSAEIECKFALRIRDDVFRPGRVRVHLPAPVNADWLYMGQVLASSPEFRMISIEDHPQRSVWFDEILRENAEFSVTYAFESTPEKVTPDIEKINRAAQPGKAIDPALIKKYENGSHCDCTSYTGPLSGNVTVMDLVSESGIKVPARSEAARILGMSGEEAEAAKTGDLIKKIFDFCVRTDLAAMNGSQTSECESQNMNGSYTPACESRNVLLVTLMRACGIPARWQGGFRVVDTAGISGTAVATGAAGTSETADPAGTAGADKASRQVVPADWAIVNAAPYGWMYMDAQASREALDKGDSELASYYFGGIDALRIPTASKIGAGLYPARDYKRADEKYNRYGEVELEERGLESTEFTTVISAKVF